MRKILIPIVMIVFNITLLNAQFVDPDKDYLTKGTIVDMRAKEIFKKGHIEGSLNITIEDLKMIIQSGGFVEFHNLCVIFGISPGKKVYILPDDRTIFNAMVLAGALNYIGISEVFILKGSYKDMVETGLSVTNKGSKLNYVDWALNYTFNFLSVENFKRLQKHKNTRIINLNDTLEKNKNFIHVRQDMLLQNSFINNCEGLNKLIFTGKSKDKKDIILKSKDVFLLLGAKYLLSKVCGYDNVMLFREEGK